MELIKNSESIPFKLEHSHVFIADTLKRTKVEEDDIVIKNEVIDEADANQVDECLDLDAPSVAQKFKSCSRSNNTSTSSEISNEECEFNYQTNTLELEDNCNVANKINVSVPANNDLVDTDAKEILECHQNYEKMETAEKICRFCFKMRCTFKTIDSNIKGISDVLLPRIDLAAIQEPVMCTQCKEILLTCFNFKARCLQTHDYLIAFANKKVDGAKLNLKDIYMTKNINIISALEDQDICGFCMCPVKNCSAILLDVGERDVMLRKTLEQCLPELDLSIIEEPVICASCHVSLENHSRFVRNVLIVEEKIKKYKESLGINGRSQINLSSLIQFVLIEVDGSEGEKIKLEKMFCDHNESVDKEVERNCNVMDIDDLKCNNGQKFTPTNIFNCKIERSDIGGIKMEETFCAEDGTEFKKEDIVEVEDEKILLDEEIEIKTDDLDFNSFEDDIVMTQLKARLNGNQECALLPNFEDNRLELHIDQTCINKNVTEITPYLYDCGQFKAENKCHLKTHLLKHEHRSEMTIYKCLFCSFETNCKDSLNTHSPKHKDLFEVMYKCHSCTYQTKYKNFLKTHLMEHKNPEVTMYKCDSCLYQTKHKAQLKKHFLKHKNSSKLTMHKCDSCAYQTIRKGDLKSHLQKHKDISELTMYKCDSCLYQSKYKAELKTHLMKHKNPSEVTMHKCDSCAYQTIRKRVLKTHVLKHKDPSELTMHKCDSCTYQTIYRSALKRHLLKHKNPSEVRMHKCDSCTYQTIHRSIFKRHLLTHKDISEVTMYKCDLCLYQSKYKSELKTHLLRHKNPSEVTMHKCDSCAYQTIQKSALKKHALKHKDISEVTMYKCDSCFYQSKYKSDLKIHLLKHKNPSEVTIHKCDSCAYQTVLKSYLTKHALKHKNPSEVTMYKCDSCIYQSKYKAELKTHLMKHKNPSEITMHKCDSCAYQTIRKSDLKTHVLKHMNLSEVTMYKCDSCTYQTIHKGALKTHVLKHKDISEVTMYKCNLCLYQTKQVES